MFDGSPATVTGALRFTVVPSPSSPLPFLPQHFTVPPVSRAQVDSPSPLVMACTPEPSPVTSTGTELLLFVLFPSSPLIPMPQHFTAPALVSAQAFQPLAPIATTPELSPVTSTGTDELLVDPLPS